MGSRSLILEGWITPLLSPERLGEMGFNLVAYPRTLLSASAFAMRQAVEDLQLGKPPDKMLSFSELKALVGFDGYDSVTQ